MPLIFKAAEQQKTIYRNTGEVLYPGVIGITEKQECMQFEIAAMSIKNCNVDGFRIVHFELNQTQQTQYEIVNDIDAVKIYFNRRGIQHSEYKQVSKKYMLQSGFCNMLYSDALDTSVTHYSAYSEIFSLQLSRKYFLDLYDQAGLHYDSFCDSLSQKKTKLFSSSWKAVDHYMETCIEQILHCPFHSEMKKTYLRSKAIELFILFMHGHNEKSASADSKTASIDRERLYFARDYLIQNYASPSSLSSLSRISGLNEFKLKQGFKSLFNSTVIDFLISRRLEKARELLFNTDKTVSEIAFETGYSTPSYFGKAFKKKYGFSPGKR